MKPGPLIAAALMLLTVFVHVFAGGPEIHQPIQNSALPSVVRAVGAVLWHAVTVVLTLFFVALLWLARHENPALLWLVNGIQLGFAGLFIWYGWAQLGTLWPMPQWIIFIVIPALTLWQGRRPATAIQG